MPKKNDDKPKAFKNWINKDLLRRMAESINKVHADFEIKKFVVITAEIEKLELKARVKRISKQLELQLPKEYPVALRILLNSTELKNLSGFDLWPYTDFIQTYGINHVENSLQALYQLTQLFTSEFAIRPFLAKYPEQSLLYLLKCAEDKNVHVRRWASEGSRPRLPWGEKLNLFIEQPHLTLPIIEKLKLDDELYVRKSVANHLNDITKDNPLFVIKILKNWKSYVTKKNASKVNWIINRSLRTLIKNGDPEALKLIGVSRKINILMTPIKINKKNFRIGDRLEFSVKLKSKDSQDQKLVIDYIIHFLKANKKHTKKVFKLKNLTLAKKSEVLISKSHHLKKISTRIYYPGKHFLEIQINGISYGKINFYLRT